MAVPVVEPDLTVVLLNWDRPHNVAAAVGRYLLMPRVAHVTVFDNKAGRDREAMLRLAAVAACRVPDFTYIGAYSGRDLGLPTRFAAAGLSRTPLVLLADDDIELPGATVDRLATTVACGDASLAGLFGRAPLPDGSYVLGEHYGRVEVVLTRALVTSREACCAAFCPAMRMASALGGEPFGNGEDIVLSYAARRARRGLPSVALDLPYENRGFDSPCSISVRYAGHLSHRTQVVRWCRREFGEMAADARRA